MDAIIGAPSRTVYRGLFLPKPLSPRSRTRTHVITPWVREAFSAARATRYLGPSSLRQILEVRVSTSLRWWAMDWRLVCPTLIIRLRSGASVKRLLNFGTQMESAVLNH